MHRTTRKLEDGRGGSVSASVLRPEGFRPGRDPLVVLAHGAGAGMDHPFMTSIQKRLGERGLAVALFNFPYKEKGGKAPDTRTVLEGCYLAVVEQLRADPRLKPGRLIIGGKSMGGRIATQIAAAGCPSDGIILLGYPLHPPGKPEKMRRAHLPDIAVPMLFLQGTRDSLCNLEQLRPLLAEIPAQTRLHVVVDGDHSFKVLKRTGRDQDEVLDELADVCVAWVAGTDQKNPKNQGHAIRK